MPLESPHWPNVIVYTLAAFGVMVPPEKFFAGLFLASACGFIMFVMRPEKQNRDIWFMLLLATVMSILVAIIHPHSEWISWIPLQLCMAVTGLISRPVVYLFDNFSNRVVERSDHVADKVIDRVLGASDD